MVDENGFRGQHRGLVRVCPKWSSKSFVIMAEVRVITASKGRMQCGKFTMYEDLYVRMGF
jgi:hypothetical protein